MATPPNFLAVQYKQVVGDLVARKGFVLLDGAFYRQMKCDLGLTRSQVHHAINSLALDRKVMFVREPGRLGVRSLEARS